VFRPKFEKLSGVQDGYFRLTKQGGENGDYVQWVVYENKVGSFPFKTYYGIPAYTRLRGRKFKNMTGLSHPASLL